MFRRDRPSRVSNTKFHLGLDTIYELAAGEDELRILQSNGDPATVRTDNVRVTSLTPGEIVMVGQDGSLTSAPPQLPSDHLDFGNVAQDIGASQPCKYTLGTPDARWNANLCDVTAETLGVGSMLSSLVPRGDHALGSAPSPWDEAHVRNVFTDEISVSEALLPASDDVTLGSLQQPWSALFTDNVYCNSISVYETVLSDLIPRDQHQSLGSAARPWTSSHVVHAWTDLLDVEFVNSDLVPTRSTQTLGTPTHPWAAVWTDAIKARFVYVSNIAGDGWQLSNLHASNLSHGVVPNDVLVGDYDQLGNVTAVSFAGDGTALTNLDADHIRIGTLHDDRLNGTYHVTEMHADYFHGDGRGLTNLNASELTTGHVPPERLEFGDYSFNSVTANLFIGDGSGLTDLNADELVRGVVPNERLKGSYTKFDHITAVSFEGSGAGLTDLPASNVVGRLESANLPTNPTFTTVTATTTSGSGFTGSGSLLTALNASELKSGTVPNARLSGSYNGFNVLTANKFVGNGSSLTGIAKFPVGSIMLWINSSPPSGWFKLQGDSFSTSRYPKLHSYLQGSTGYSSGRLPDWSGRYPVEYGGHATDSLGTFLGPLTAAPKTPFKTASAVPDGGTRGFSGAGSKNAYSDSASRITIAGGDSTTRPLSVIVHYIIKHD
jgi:hypothetical protein